MLSLCNAGPAKLNVHFCSQGRDKSGRNVRVVLNYYLTNQRGGFVQGKSGETKFQFNLLLAFVSTLTNA